MYIIISNGLVTRLSQEYGMFNNQSVNAAAFSINLD